MEHKISPSSNEQLTTPEWVSQHINHQGVDVVHPPLNQQVTHIKPPISSNPTKPKSLDHWRLSSDFDPGEVDWVVDKLFDVGRLHLVCGPVLSGKTRILLKMIDDIQNGLPFLGRSTTRKKCLLIDGCRDKLSMKVAMRSLGIDPSTIPLIPAMEIKQPLETILNTLVPDETELIVIDNLAMLMGDFGRSSDPTLSNSAVVRFLGFLKTWCAKNMRTVIASHSLLKHENGSKYLAQKSKIAGSGMWLAQVETALIIDEEDPQDLLSPYRQVTTLFHNHVQAASKRYELKSDGRLYVAPKTPENDIRTALGGKASKALEIWQKLPINESRALNDLMQEWPMSRASFFRYIKELLALEMIKKMPDGRYKRVETL